MTDRAQDAEAIRAALEHYARLAENIYGWTATVVDSRRAEEAAAALGRLVARLEAAANEARRGQEAATGYHRRAMRAEARLEAAERALRRIEQAATRPPVAKRYAVTEFCDYVFRIARAALAAAAPGETEQTP